MSAQIKTRLIILNRFTFSPWVMVELASVFIRIGDHGNPIRLTAFEQYTKFGLSINLDASLAAAGKCWSHREQAESAGRSTPPPCPIAGTDDPKIERWSDWPNRPTLSK